MKKKYTNYMKRIHIDKLLKHLSDGDPLSDSELLEVYALLGEAFSLAIRLGTRGDMLRHWAAKDLSRVEGYLKHRGVKFQTLEINK